MEQIFKNKTMKKEEQKQHLIDIMKDDEELELYEEAAENKYGLSDQYWKDRIGFVHGAKWQAERMYSEEDMLAFSEFISLNFPNQNKFLQKINQIFIVLSL